MNLGEICTRDVVFATRDCTILSAAQLMREYHVGNLVVVEHFDGARIPVGIITDRDIVIGVLAPELDAKTLTVGDIMFPELVTAGETDGVFETMQLMRRKGVRRLPVVDPKGGLAGIVSLDDLIELVAEEITELSGLIARERHREQATRK